MKYYQANTSKKQGMALFFVAVGPVVLISIALCLYIRFRRSTSAALLPTEWPILGILPSVLSVLNSHSFHDSITGLAIAVKSLNLRVRGPPLTSLSCIFFTCDPENVNHIFTKNFANYPKGDDFASMFPLLEGTIFTTDGEPWRLQRRRIHHVLTSPPLLDAVSRSCRDKVAGGLVPSLSRMAATGTALDIQDMLGRLVFDMIVTAVFGEDPCCLSPAGLISSKPPVVPMAAALDTLAEVALFRHTVPPLCWKAMRWFKVGPERNVAAAETVLWDFVAEKIQTRMAAGGRRQTTADVDILSHYIEDPDFFNDAGEPTDFMHRTFINFLFALHDPMASALPWFVYCLAMHPRVVSAVRDELAPIVVNQSRVSSAAAANSGGGPDDMVIFEPEELEHLVYLRAALFESLRLYPPGPILRKVAAADDVLPSGHTVHAGDTILVLVYTMARMESIWGDDCWEYRPERWLSESMDDDRPARLRFVPSYKFLSFNTGPRSCIGKNIAVTQMMSIAAAVAWNFDVEVVEGHAVQPKLSVLLQMSNGLMVRVNKRGQQAHGQG